MPRARARSRVRASISASVVRPYSSGSRSPSRFRFGPFNTAMCTSAVPTCRGGPLGRRARARSVGTALGLEAPEPGLELIEVALVLHRGPDPRAGAAGRTRGRRAAFGPRGATGRGSGSGRRGEELVEREPAGRGRRSPRCRLLWRRRARVRRHGAVRALLAEHGVERDAVVGGPAGLAGPPVAGQATPDRRAAPRPGVLDADTAPPWFP